MRRFIALSFAILSFDIFAAELHMATITTDVDKDVSVFYLETDDENNVHSMRYITTTPRGQISEDQTYSLEEVISNGAVVEQRMGRDVVTLYVENFDPASGGIIRLAYLYNGISGSMREIKLKLVRENNLFKLTDLQNRPVNHMFFKGNWVPIAGLVGIRDITLSFNTGLKSSED